MERANIIIMSEDFITTLEGVTAVARTQCELLVTKINTTLSGLSPLELIVITLAACIVMSKVLSMYNTVRREGLKTVIFRFATKFPGMIAYIKKEQEKFISETRVKYEKLRHGKSIKEMPTEGWSEAKLLAKLGPESKAATAVYSDNKISGAVYIAD